MARTKRVAKGLQADLIARATGKNQEPEFSQLVAPSKIQLARALSFYSVAKAYKPDEYKSMAISWVKKNRPELLDVVSNAKPYRFQTYGPLMRMNTRGMIFDDQVKAKIDAFLLSLKEETEEDELDEDGNLILTEKPKKSRKVKVNTNLQYFDDELDKVMVEWDPKSGVTFEIDPTQDVTPVITRCEEMLENFKVEDIQQYPLHMKIWLKAVIKKLSGIEKIVKVRKPRKARVRKVNPVKMTQKVKHLKSDSTLKINSKNAVDMVGKQKIYLYDTKYKKMTKLVCADAAGFLIKGTTVQNFDPEKSTVAFIKKPETALKDAMGIRELDRAMNMTKSKRKADPKGRINEYTLIMNIS